jgi:hypothetical protein
MQSQIAKWEQSQLFPRLASSPPPATDFLQPAYNFLSSTSASFGSFTASITPQNSFEPFASQTAIASQATSIFDSLLGGTISSSQNGGLPPASQQLVANSLATAQTNANIQG